MESTKNMKNTSKPKFTLIAKNVIPSSPEQGLYSSMISSFTNESIKKPMLLPSIKGNKKNNNILISTQIKQMKSISQRISSNGFGVNGFNIRNIKSKTKQKTNKTSKTKTIFKKINNNNTIYDMSQSTVKKNDKKTKPQQICQWFHFTKTNNLYLFIPNSKYISHIKNNSFISSPLFQITKPMSLPEAFRIRMFKYTHMPICITSSMNNGGVNLTKYVHKSNVLWKLIPTYQMRELLRQIHPNIKFNHFPATFQLGRKDNLFRNYRRFNNIFPKEYNYVPNTYLLPYDAERFQNDFMFTKKNHKKKWIAKPANLSCGRGIHILKGEKDFLKMLK